MATIPNTSPTMYTIPGTNPSTVIELYKGVKIPSDYSFIFRWANRTNQDNYFSQHVTKKVTISNMLYINEEATTMRLGLPIKELTGRNYLTMINQSGNFENKKFYYFVTGIKYVNNNVTEITIQLDVWNTFYWDIDFDECLIVRQHTPSDYYFEHLVPESIGTGEYFSQRYWETSDNHKELSFDRQALFLGITIDQNGDPFQNIHAYGPNFFMSGELYLLPIATNAMARNQLNALLTTYHGHYDECFTLCYMVPEWVYYLLHYPVDAGQFVIPYGDDKPIIASRSLNFLINADNGWAESNEYTEFGTYHYEPRNAKLYSAPYRYLRLVSTSGDTRDYPYEMFEPKYTSGVRSLSFTQYCNPVASDSQGCNVITVPDYFRGRTKNWEESVQWSQMQPFPLTNNNMSKFIDYNKTSLVLAPLKFALSAGTAIAGFGSMSSYAGATSRYNSAMANAPAEAQRRPFASTSEVRREAQAQYMSDIHNINVGNYNSLMMGLGNSIESIDRASAFAHNFLGHPPTTSSIASSTGLSANHSGVFLQDIWLRVKDLKRLDAYFDKYGYALDIVDKPNLCARDYFTYIQTSGCKVKPLLTNLINSNYIEMIQGIFNKGTTVWNGEKNVEIGHYTENLFELNKASQRGFKSV